MATAKDIRDFYGKPWPALELSVKPKGIDPETGIAPIGEWKGFCQRGFVRDSRFGTCEVIKPTNRGTTRKWLAIDKGKSA